MKKILKLNVFKEIAIGLSQGHQTNLESPASLSEGLPVLISKCCRYPCLQLIFDVARSFVGLPLNRALHLIIKEIVI